MCLLNSKWSVLHIALCFCLTLSCLYFLCFCVCMFVSRRSQEADQQESSFLDTERPPSTFTSSSPEQNDLKTTVSTSQDSFPNDIPDQSQHLMSCSLRSKSLERRPLDSTPTVSIINTNKNKPVCFYHGC